MLSIRPVFFALFLAANTAAAQECDCIWRGSFSDVTKQTDLIIAGEIISRSGNSADIKIEKIFQGKHFQDSARIWGTMTLRDGTPLCRANLEEFPTGSRWVLALEKITDVPKNGFNPATPSLGYGRKDDYALSNCGAYWLAADGETARGNLVNGKRWSYDNRDKDNNEIAAISFQQLTDFLSGKLSAKQLLELTATTKEFRKLMNQSRQQILKNDIETLKTE
jgi:hypothetical protein